MKESFMELVNAITEMKYAPPEYDSLELDMDCYNKYVSRFHLFMEDGVPLAINSYLSVLLREDVNDYTKNMIQLEAMRLISGGK